MKIIKSALTGRGSSVEWGLENVLFILKENILKLRLIMSSEHWEALILWIPVEPGTWKAPGIKYLWNE